MATFGNTSALEYLPKLETELGLPAGFLVSLEDDDDWSYVVKLHALLETAVAHVVIAAIGDKRLEKVIYSLPLGNTRHGKLAIADALEVLGDGGVEYIQFVTEIRNKLVHRIQNVSFKFKEHFDAIDDESLINLFCKWGYARIEIGAYKETLPLLRAKAKTWVHLRALLLLELIYIERQSKLLEHKHTIAFKTMLEKRMRKPEKQK